MASVTLTSDNFDSIVLDNEIVFVDFWAEWCGPCKQFGPIFEAASDTHADIVFGKVDTETELALATAAKITSIPTLMAFRDGVLVFAQPGALPAGDLDRLVGAVKDIDMDDVRRQIAEQQAEAEQAEAEAASEVASE